MIARIIAALMLVLGIASSAWSECAWVLWTRSQEPGIRGWFNGPRWSPHAGYTSKAECEDPLGILKRGSDPQGITGGAQAPAQVQDQTWRCLPDTVDPRGPKSSGR